jgi:aspartyl-tRNA(Asn)/glutamyl-tRNA(Gln) amidotransferase subunit B
MQNAYEAVIGLEVHAQLRTNSKIFSSAPVAFGAPANTLVNEVCAGYPGSLPVLNREAVTLAIRAGLALGCQVHHESEFARKNYFYPDLPKGYQISQYERPLCTHGRLQFEVGGQVMGCGVTRIHIEEDTGQSQHDGEAPVSLIDLNRAGTGLIEIVSEPELRTAEQASAYFKELRAILVAIGINDGMLANGAMRCDANVSVRLRGTEAFGTKVEVKNLNSFKFLREAIQFEIERQVQEIESGGRIWQETRLWDDARKMTFMMRRKEGSADYRYFPEPDLPLLVVGQDWIESVRSSMPELPADTRARLQERHGLSAYDAGVLVANDGFVSFFDRAVAVLPNAKGIANWLTGGIAAGLNGGTLRYDMPADRFVAAAGHEITADAVAELQRLIDENAISTTIARGVWEKMLLAPRLPTRIVDEDGLRQVSDAGAIEAIIDAVIAGNPSEVERYRAGQQQLFGFLVGQAMKASKGKGDPKLVNARLRSRLDEGA